MGRAHVDPTQDERGPFVERLESRKDQLSGGAKMMRRRASRGFSAAPPTQTAPTRQPGLMPSSIRVPDVDVGSSWSARPGA